MRRWAGGGRGDQPVLLALDVRQELPADHLVWAVLEVVGELDVSAFEAAYRTDGWSRPPYHPRTMLALIFYCWRKKLRSGQEIATACRDDLGARVIMGGGRPDPSTITRFQRRHAAAIQGLLVQTLRLGQAEDLVDVSVVAGDGTKVVANAAMSRTGDRAGLMEEITRLQQQLADAEAAWTAAVTTGQVRSATAQDDPFADAPSDQGPPGRAGRVRGDATDAAWRRIGQLQRRITTRQAALTWLDEHPPVVAEADWRERLERDQARVRDCRRRLEEIRTTLQQAWDARVAAQGAGRVFRGPPMVEPARHSQVARAQAALNKATARAAATVAARPAATRVNTTDPASRIMLGKHDGYDQRYNLQALACPGPFILAITVHDSPNDKQALTGLLTTARANLDAAGITTGIGTSLHDSGYASAANFTADLPVDLLLVGVEKEARQTGRTPDRPSTAHPGWAVMAERLADPANAALYKRRAAIIEPLFAHLFTRFGRALTSRGNDVVTELHLWATAHNLYKIIDARQRARARPSAA